jgi:hypothetical protein
MSPRATFLQRPAMPVDLWSMSDSHAWHLVAHTRSGWRAVVQWSSASWLWAQLRRHFPLALGCMLMRDHLHLLARGEPRELRALLARVLRAHGRRFGPVRWDVAEPAPARTVAIARRTLRYLLLNPVRSNDVDDPLSWPWSTLRDVLGAVVDPWVDAERLHALLPAPARDPAQAWHRIIVQGSEPASAIHRFPRPASSTLVFPLHAARESAAAALRSHPDATQQRGATRRLFVQSVRQLHPVPTIVLARACSITPRSTRDLLRNPDPRALRAVHLCLGDERLRQWTVPSTNDRPLTAPR